MTQRVSVALCTYNGSLYIEKQIESILSQSRQVDQIVISDDASEDDTLEKIQLIRNESKAAIEWKIIRNEKPKGVIKNFEQAIGHCTGDIIFLSDQDDIWYPHKVDTVIRYFLSHPKTLLVFTDADLIDASGDIQGRSLWESIEFTKELQQIWTDNRKAFNLLFRANNKITGATISFRSSLKRRILPINLPENYLHDTWLGLFAAAENGLKYLREPLIQYRIHAQQYIGVGGGKGSVQDKDKAKPVSFNSFAWEIFKRYPKAVLNYCFRTVLRKMGLIEL